MNNKFNSNHYKGDWYIKDISKETNTLNFLTLNTYSDVLEEDTEIATIIIDDIDVSEKAATFKVISNANNMFELLEECYYAFEKLNNEVMKKKIEKLMLSMTNETIYIYE